MSIYRLPLCYQTDITTQCTVFNRLAVAQTDIKRYESWIQTHPVICLDTSHNVDSTQLADLTLFVAYQFGLGLFLEQQLVGRIVHDLSRAGDAILGKIQICHVTNTSFLKNGHVYSALSSHRISQKAIEIYDCVFSYLTLYIKIRQNQQTWT